MKNKSILLPAILLVAIASTLIIASCNKKFDAPPGYIAPDITPNISIKALKSLHTLHGYNPINSNYIIAGIVVGDDKNGNLYKEICIRDSTGGIAVLLDGTNLYTSYPAGRQVFIKCNGLYLSDYGHAIQLGMINMTVPTNPTITGIPATLFDTYVVKGSLNNIVTPKVVAITDLLNNASDSLQSELLQLNNVQFRPADTGHIYADTSAAKLSISDTILDCSGNAITVYTSGYSNFAGVKPPQGNGSIAFVFTPYWNSSDTKRTPELIIVDTNKVQLYGPRCTGGNGGGGTGGGTSGGGGTSNTTPVSSIRSLYSGNNAPFSTTMQVGGIVISDATNKNLSAGNIIIQSGRVGISLYFGSSAATTNFNIGDSIVFTVTTADSLLNYDGSLEIKFRYSSSLPTAAVSTGNVITPQTLTIAQLNAALSSAPSSFENVLVKITGATASGGTTYSGSKTLSDASGNITLYTASGATFAGTTLPAGSHTWTGYAQYYKGTSKEFIIRNTEDVQ